VLETVSLTSIPLDLNFSNRRDRRSGRRLHRPARPGREFVERPPRDIFWEAHVILLGEPNPELVVDQTGKILKLTNIEFLGANAGKGVDDTLVGPIVLKDIIYDDDEGKVKFFANSISGASASNIWGNRGVFEIQRTWDRVRIENNSGAGSGRQ
jgi:hypothetical protein